MADLTRILLFMELHNSLGLFNQTLCFGVLLRANFKAIKRKY